MIVLQLIVWLVFGAVALISFAYFMRMCELTEKGENKDFPRKLVATIELRYIDPTLLWGVHARQMA